MSRIPWTVQYWHARLNAGHYLLPYMRLAVCYGLRTGRLCILRRIE